MVTNGHFKSVLLELCFYVYLLGVLYIHLSYWLNFYYALSCVLLSVGNIMVKHKILELIIN